MSSISVINIVENYRKQIVSKSIIKEEYIEKRNIVLEVIRNREQIRFSKTRIMKSSVSGILLVLIDVLACLIINPSLVMGVSSVVYATIGMLTAKDTALIIKSNILLSKHSEYLNISDLTLQIHKETYENVIDYTDKVICSIKSKINDCVKLDNPKKSIELSIGLVEYYINKSLSDKIGIEFDRSASSPVGYNSIKCNYDLNTSNKFFDNSISEEIQYTDSTKKLFKSDGKF